jgi:hypothetical protein
MEGPRSCGTRLPQIISRSCGTRGCCGRVDRKKTLQNSGYSLVVVADVVDVVFAVNDQTNRDFCTFLRDRKTSTTICAFSSVADVNGVRHKTVKSMIFSANPGDQIHNRFLSHLLTYFPPIFMLDNDIDLST